MLPLTAIPWTGRRSDSGRPAGRQIRSHRADSPGDRRPSGCVTVAPERLSIPRPGPRSPSHDPQFARLLGEWLSLIGLDPALFGTHSLRRTKVTLIYRKTGNLRAVQLLLGHTKIESTVRYLGIEVDDALAIAEQIEV